MKKFFIIVLIIVLSFSVVNAKSITDLLNELLNTTARIYLKDFHYVATANNTGYSIYYYIEGTVQAVEDDYVKIYGKLYIEFGGDDNFGDRGDACDNNSRYYYIPLSNIAYFDGASH